MRHWCVLVIVRLARLLTSVVCPVLLGLPVVLFSAQCSAQVTPGSPPFASEDSHQYDTINLADLHIVVQVPLRDKASGPLPFSYDLVMNNYLSNAGYPHMGLKAAFSGERKNKPRICKKSRHKRRRAARS